MGYLCRGTVLTNDNLLATICREVRSVIFSSWRDNWACFLSMHFCALYMVNHASNLYPPRKVANMYSHWLDGITHKFNALTRVGVSVLLWSKFQKVCLLWAPNHVHARSNGRMHRACLCDEPNQAKRFSNLCSIKRVSAALRTRNRCWAKSKQTKIVEGKEGSVGHNRSSKDIGKGGTG